MNKTQMSVQVGKRLAYMRHMRGLTQGTLAYRVRMSRTSITNLESGRQNMGLWTLMTLASALNLAPHAFLLPDPQWRAWMDDIEACTDA